MRIGGGWIEWILYMKEFILQTKEGRLIAVTHLRKLKQLAKEGWIEFPTKWGGGFQVAEGPKEQTYFERYEPSYDLTIKYRIKYIDGSIYPYLFMVQPHYGNTCRYAYYY